MPDIIEKIGVMKAKDEDGNVYALYPETKMEAIEGLSTTLNQINGDISDIVEAQDTLQTHTEEVLSTLQESVTEMGNELEMLEPDATLSVSGKAADAKAVGDKLDAMRTDVIGTLEVGKTSLTLSDSAIKTDSTIDIYTSIYGVNPTDVVVSDGKIELTFGTQSTEMNVKVRVS